MLNDDIQSMNDARNEPFFGQYLSARGFKIDIPRMVRRTFSQKLPPHPISINTPRGGRIMAKKILQISLEEG